MSKLFENFWKWYEQHYTINITIAAILFTLQIVHLYWLTTHVVIHKLISVSLWDPTPFLQLLIIIVDYTEIPAIVTTSLVFINDLRKGVKFKPLLYLFFLDIQLLHIFWITDEFVLETFTVGGGGTILPVWLAWVAILVDYLELPVIFETINKALLSLRKQFNQ